MTPRTSRNKLLIERGVPQAYVRARASSTMLCLVYGSFSVFPIYQTGNLIRIKMGLDAYLIRIQTRTPLSRHPPYDYSAVTSVGGQIWVKNLKKSPVL